VKTPANWPTWLHEPNVYGLVLLVTALVSVYFYVTGQMLLWLGCYGLQMVTWIVDRKTQDPDEETWDGGWT
jgi:hypothetical protein